jgi:hypothetical protein
VGLNWQAQGADAANKRITDAPGAQDGQTESELGEEGYDDVEQAS